jgi:hypothetical protein
MKLFLKNTLIFGSLLLSLHVILTFSIPHEWLYFGPGMEFKVYRHELLPGWFYPNKYQIGTGRGDLAQRGDYGIPKPNQAWYLDSLGFRNRHFKNDAPIFILGESYVVGANLSQEEIVSEYLERLSEVDVYNLSDAAFIKLRNLLQAGLVKKPELLIYMSVERGICNYPRPEIESWFIDQKALYPLFEAIDRLLKLDYLRKPGATLSRRPDLGVPGGVDPNYRFLYGPEVLEKDDYGDAQRSAAIIKHYYDLCKQVGIDFVFVSLPNKETTAYQLVPLEKAPPFLDELAFHLDSMGVPNLNGKYIFEQHPEPSSLFFPDDTHWNAEGVRVMTDSIFSFLKENQLLAKLQHRKNSATNSKAF